MTEDIQPDPSWENELTNFLKEASASFTNSAVLFGPDTFDVGVGTTLSSRDDYLTIFVKAKPDDEHYALSICFEKAGAAKVIQGLLAGYRHLYLDDADDE